MQLIARPPSARILLEVFIHVLEPALGHDNLEVTVALPGFARGQVEGLSECRTHIPRTVATAEGCLPGCRLTTGNSDGQVLSCGPSC